MVMLLFHDSSARKSGIRLDSRVKEITIGESLYENCDAVKASHKCICVRIVVRGKIRVRSKSRKCIACDERARAIYLDIYSS